MFYGTTTLVALGSVDSRVQSGTLSSVRADPNVLMKMRILLGFLHLNAWYARCVLRTVVPGPCKIRDLSSNRGTQR